MRAALAIIALAAVTSATQHEAAGTFDPAKSDQELSKYEKGTLIEPASPAAAGPMSPGIRAGLAEIEHSPMEAALDRGDAVGTPVCATAPSTASRIRGGNSAAVLPLQAMDPKPAFAMHTTLGGVGLMRAHMSESSTATDCRAMCKSNSRCVAYVFQADSAKCRDARGETMGGGKEMMCWLKATVTLRRADNCTGSEVLWERDPCPATTVAAATLPAAEQAALREMAASGGVQAKVEESDGRTVEYVEVSDCDPSVQVPFCECGVAMRGKCPTEECKPCAHKQHLKKTTGAKPRKIDTADLAVVDDMHQSGKVQGSRKRADGAAIEYVSGCSHIEAPYCECGLAVHAVVTKRGVAVTCPTGNCKPCLDKQKQKHKQKQHHLELRDTPKKIPMTPLFRESLSKAEAAADKMKAAGKFDPALSDQELATFEEATIISDNKGEKAAKDVAKAKKLDPTLSDQELATFEHATMKATAKGEKAAKEVAKDAAAAERAATADLAHAPGKKKTRGSGKTLPEHAHVTQHHKSAAAATVAKDGAAGAAANKRPPPQWYEGELIIPLAAALSMLCGAIGASAASQCSNKLHHRRIGRNKKYRSLAAASDDDDEDDDAHVYA